MNPNVPAVSIGLPVYNGEQYLHLALDSLLCQSYHDFELIISDNGSTDSTQQICEDYARKDSRIRYIRGTRNRGATWNYNNVFWLARGRYFKWASHDDLCAPTFLERCVDILDRYPSAVACVPRTIIIDESGEAIEPYPFSFAIHSARPSKRYAQFHSRYREADYCNPIFGLFRSEILAKTPLIESYSSSDRVLLGEVSLYGEVYEVPEHLFYYRNNTSVSWRCASNAHEELSWYDPQKRQMFILRNWTIFRKHFAQVWRVDIPPKEKLLCYHPLVAWAFWNHSHFAKDLAKALIFWRYLKPLLLRLTIVWKGPKDLAANQPSDRSATTGSSMTNGGISSPRSITVI